MSKHEKKRIQYRGTVLEEEKSVSKPRYINIPYKNTPLNLEKALSVEVGKDKLNPIINLYCQLYYQPYLQIIYSVGKGYMATQHLVYFMKQLHGVKENVVRTAIVEMEQMHLIACDRINNNLIIRLKALGLQYITENKNNRSLPKTTARAMIRSFFICEQQIRDWVKNKLALKGSGEKLEELMQYLALYQGNSLNIQLLLAIEKNTDILFRAFKVDAKKNKVILYFAILDTGSTIGNKAIIWNTGRVIRALREMIGDTTFNKLFLVDFIIYTENEKRKKIVEKNLGNICTKIYTHNSKTISLDTHIQKVGVASLNIDRLYRYPCQGGSRWKNLT